MEYLSGIGTGLIISTLVTRYLYMTQNIEMIPLIFGTLFISLILVTNLLSLYEVHISPVLLFMLIGCSSLLSFLIYQYIKDYKSNSITSNDNISSDVSQYKVSSINYTPISPELIQYIVDAKTSVIEMCAGNGDNATILRDKGVKVYAYDIKSIDNKVAYGLCGMVETNHPDADILLICSGMDAVRSVQKFTGSIIIIGGYVYPSVVKTQEAIESLSDPVPLVKDQHFTLELRPSFHTIQKLGWKFDRAYFSPRGSSYQTHFDAFYIFLRK